METLVYAPEAWKALNGIFCVYKPAGLPINLVRNTLVFSLCRDLNEMEKRKPRDLVLLKGSVASGKPLEVALAPNYADHELVCGPRYQVQDVRMKWISYLGKNTSGVLPMAVNDGCKVFRNLNLNNFLRKYEVKGKFGIATTTFMEDGKVMERSTYSHIHQSSLDRLLASIQASHQALAYQYSGVDMQSQAAYDLASKGIVRPSGKSNPIIYGIKCSEFSPPDFTLEIQCINETEVFLAELIHQIGIYLKSTAICTLLRQEQFGHFTVDHALLRKHWTLENILSNVTLCKELIAKDNFMPNSAHFEAIKMSSLKDIMQNMQDKIRQEFL